MCLVYIYPNQLGGFREILIMKSKNTYECTLSTMRSKCFQKVLF